MVRQKGANRVEFTSQEYEPMELGSYECKVVKIEADPEGQFGPQVIFEFEVMDEDYEGRVLKGWASMPKDGKMTPVHKLHGWLSAIRGSQIGEGETVKTEELVGKRVMVHIDHKKTDRGTFDKVKDLTPLRKRKGQKTQAEKDLAEAEEAFEDIDMTDQPKLPF